MELYPSGDAIFSTHLNRYSPRAASAGPIVLRSSPDDDQDSMVARLRWKFPQQCKVIRAPIENIYQWFDPYDTHRHGYAFLHSVLSTIAFQNSIRASQIHNFVEMWKRTNPGRFDAITPHSHDIFAHNEIWEFGHEFLTDASRILRALRRATPPYFRSRTPNTEGIPRVDSEFELVADNPHSFYCNSDSRSFGTNRARPRAHSASPPTDSISEVPLGQTSNSDSTYPNQIPADPSSQVSFQGPQQMHLSARRGEFRNYPEYHNYTFPPPKPDQELIFATPPAGLRGGFSHQNKPLNARLKPLHEPRKTFEPASSVPNPPKIASDDARVLELQEANRAPKAFLKTTQGLTATQLPLRAPSQVAPLVEGQSLTSSSFTQPISHQNRLDYTLSNDPAVVFFGNRSGSGTYCENHSQKQKEIRFLRKNEQYRNENRRPSRQWPYTSINDKSGGEDQPPANAHLAGANHQSFQPHKGRNLQNSEHFQYRTTQEKQEASSRLDIPSHQPLPFSNHGEWPAETGRSAHYPARLYDDDERKVYVGNLTTEFTPHMIRALFDPKVPIGSISNVKTKNLRGGLGFAFVTFVKASDAIDTIKTLDSTYPTSFGGRRLLLKQAYTHRKHRAGDGSQDFDASAALTESLVEANEMINKDEAAKTVKAHERRRNSDTTGSPIHIQLSRAKSSRSSPNKTSNNSARPKRSNEKTPSKKTAVLNEESGLGRRKISQRVHASASATNLPSSKNMSRHMEKDERPTVFTNQKETSGPTEGRGIMAGKLIIQPPEMNDHVGFPPLVGSRPGATLSETAAPPYFGRGVSAQSQSEANYLKAKDEMLDDTSGIAGMAHGLQESAKLSPIEMVRGENIPTAQSVQSPGSIQVTEPTFYVQSERSDCYTNDARLSTDMIAESQPMQVPPTLAQSEGRLCQQGIEDSCVAAELAKNLEACAAICPIEPEIGENPTGPIKTTPGSRLEEGTSVEESAKPITSHANLDLVESATIQSLTRTEPNELVTPTKRVTTLGVKTSPETPTSDSGQASLPHANAQQFNRRQSEMPTRTSSLSSPATPIVTHKKKQRVFTPLTENSGQPVEAKVQPGRSVSLKSVGTVGWEIVSGNHFEDNKPSPELFNISPPTLEQQEVTHNNERKDHTKQPSSSSIPSSTVPPSTLPCSTMPSSTISPSQAPSTIPQPKKPKPKNTARPSKSKSKGRQIPSDLLVNKTATSPSEEKSRIYQNLPEPETPYLVDNQYVQPKIDKKVHADSHATSIVNQHLQPPHNRVAIDPVYKRGPPTAMQSSTWFSDFFSQHVSNEPTLEKSNEASPMVTVKSFEPTASHSDQSGSPTTDLSKGSSHASESCPEDTCMSRSSASNFGKSKVRELFDHLSNEVTKSSDLPFRQLYSNLGSAISTTAVVASSPRHDSLSSSSTFGKSLSNDVAEGGVADLPVTPSNKVFPSSGSAASTPSTVVHKQTSDMASPKRHVVVSDKDDEASASSTPTRRGRRFRRGHNRGTSLTSRKSSSAEITARNDRAAKADTSSSASPSGPRTPRTPPRVHTLNPRSASPPSTPNSWAFPSYAAAAAQTPKKGSPPLNSGDIILIGSSERPVQGTAGKSDPWQVPKGEKAWGK